MGLSIPRDLGFASLAVHGDDGHEAGVRHDHRLLGRAALRRVDSRIRTGDLGPPSHPSSELVAGRWVEGASLRPPADAS